MSLVVSNVTAILHAAVIYKGEDVNYQDKIVLGDFSESKRQAPQPMVSVFILDIAFMYVGMHTIVCNLKLILHLERINCKFG